MKIRTAVLVLVPVLVAAGCGDDDDVTTAPDAAATTAAASGDVPERIVSLSPTSTEILFAIDADDLVVAVDSQSNYPDDVPKTDLSAYEPNVEAIAEYEPDLVVSSSNDPALVDGLERLDIEVLVQEAAVEIDDVYRQIEELGDVTGHEDDARRLTEEMREEVDDIAEGARDRPPLTAYWELDPTYYSITSETFIGRLLTLANVTSIADRASADVEDYPQLSAEFILQTDPDLVLLADTKCCQQNAESIRARPGWSTMKAVTNGNVVSLDDDVASRWGPRIVELLRLIDGAAEKAAA